ncbi:SDR family NAD(P)-dependent oxidoreductase [Paenibacillus rhizophilus]|uniref:SDR family NAD(P)-dependent oxidoreductase n=1 Tax=Paenibacillus rhizophilus TaxID=1850366 RepID=UPI001639B52A|nr:SDR family oxidoreductase [Paenibacillus rhizophilus]
MCFSNKLFIVSGSNSGIGKACAELLLESEATVMGLDIKTNTISHSNYIHYSVDVRDEEQIMAVITEIHTKYGKIEGLANCAGIFANSKPFYELSLAEWNGVIGTNLSGVFILSKYVAQKMIPYKAGKIVNISCIRSKIFRPHMADYAAAKGGVVALTSAMALDLAPYHITVNSVAPGFTYTGMTAESFDIPEIRRSSEELIPAGRIAEPKDIANVVLFLLSDKANYINGETIFADGGFSSLK